MEEQHTVIGSGHGSLAALVLTHRPVLLEGRGSLDRGRVGAPGRVDVIIGAVAIDGTKVRSA
jgi:hypothetical protein